MQGIPTKSILGNVRAVQSEAPKHTEAGHTACAYYHTTDEGEHLRRPMSCPHGCRSDGAFYNEDYIRDLRIACQSIISLWDEGAGYAFSKPMKAAIAKLKELV
jgi:hypothetical protein